MSASRRAAGARAAGADAAIPPAGRRTPERGSPSARAARADAAIPPAGQPDAVDVGNLPRIDASAEGAVVSVRVQPRARREAIAGVHGDALKVALAAPPVDGAANEALVKFLAGLCAVPPSSVRIVGGQTSRQKRVLFASLDAAAVGERLRRALEA